MKVQVRAYQTKAVKAATKSWKGSILIVAPGGSGKTIIAARAVKLARKRKKRVLLVSHRREIVRQTVETLKDVGEKPTIIMGNETSEEQGSVIVASIATLTKRGEYPEADVVIIDEAHRAAAASYADLITHYRKKARIVGLSATPRRLDGLGLGMFFDEMYEAAKPSQLVGKYIMKPTPFSAPPEYLPELMGLKVYEGTGDFRPAELVKRINKHGLIGGIVAQMKKHWKPGDLAVVFCVSIKHSKNVAAALCKAGFKAAHLDGTMASAQRDQILDDLKNRKIEVITSCMLLTEGWDLPDCNIVVLARPTASEALYLQMANRCVRPSKRRSKVLDHACCTVMHHHVHMDREWSLDGKKRGDPKKPDLRLKICEFDGCINEPGAAHCMECGNPLKKTRIGILNELDGLDLTEWTKREKVRRRQKIHDFAKKKGFDSKWIAAVEALWLVV